MLICFDKTYKVNTTLVNPVNQMKLVSLGKLVSPVNLLELVKPGGKSDDNDVIVVIRSYCRVIGLIEKKQKVVSQINSGKC